MIKFGIIPLQPKDEWKAIDTLKIKLSLLNFACKMVRIVNVSKQPGVHADSVNLSKVLIATRQPQNPPKAAPTIWSGLHIK